MSIVSGLVRLGSRPYFISLIVTLVVAECGSQPPCAGDECSTGGSGGEAGEGGAGGDAGQGGEGGDTTGGGGQGGSAGEGGVGGSETGGGGAGGVGGAGGAGGQGGTGGGCEPVGACDAKACGTIDDCGDALDCGTCDGQLGDPSIPGIMTCGGDHLCHCKPEGDSPEAMAFCEGAGAEQPVKDFCVMYGGCFTALCGAPPIPKLSDNCIFSGKKLPNDDRVWCCVNTPKE